MSCFTILMDLNDPLTGGQVLCECNFRVISVF